MNKNIIDKYNSFWKEIIENPDGSINKNQLMKELSDFSTVIKNITHIYCELSADKASNPMIYPEIILSLYNENIENSYDQGYNDALEDYKLNEGNKNV